MILQCGSGGERVSPVGHLVGRRESCSEQFQRHGARVSGRDRALLKGFGIVEDGDPESTDPMGIEDTQRLPTQS